MSVVLGPRGSQRQLPGFSGQSFNVYAENATTLLLGLSRPKARKIVAWGGREPQARDFHLSFFAGLTNLRDGPVWS